MSDGTIVSPQVTQPIPDGQPPAKRSGLSIRSSILIMLLVVSILGALAVAAIGYQNGSNLLTSQAQNNLVQVRDSRISEVHSLFSSMENSLVLSAHGDSVIGAMQSFDSGFSELDRSKLSTAQNAALTAYFENEFGPKLATATGTTVDASTFVPSNSAARYLQANYTITFASPTAAVAVNDAGDGSDWSAANARYQDYFRRMISLQGYGDAILINSGGDIVYSAKKGVDLGASLSTGPYAQSELASAWSTAMDSNLPDSVNLSDYERFAPEYNAPTGWAVAPIASNGAIIGALAVQLPTERINSIMTDDSAWKSDGLGKTGDAYLVADDQLLRSSSRELLENPKLYSKDARAAGLPVAQVSRVLKSHSPLLVQPARTQAVAKALQGKTGIVNAPGYLGGEVIAAYAPLAIDGVNWVIVAQIDRDEAFAPSLLFARDLGIAVAIIALIVCLISLLFSQIIVTPLRRLRVDAQRISAGELGVQVAVGHSDEFVELGNAFNSMSTSLQTKQSLLEAKEEEHEQLLLSLMPEPVAKKFLNGAKTIAQEHGEVTVFYADIDGYEEYAAKLSAEKSLAQLNELLHNLDQVAEKHGVERVRTTRHGYLASCGMTIPRVDNARRMVAFAIEAQKTLDHFSAQNGAKLTILAGIDTGSATSGLVGKSRIIYDLWGDTVNLAFRLQGDDKIDGIMLTQRVVDKMPDTVVTTPAGKLTTSQGDIKIYRLDLEKTTRV
ncbi:MAG TPA: adenylate/guanylate cyclase domain-containing protein [Galbitalea sp.]